LNLIKLDSKMSYRLLKCFLIVLPAVRVVDAVTFYSISSEECLEVSCDQKDDKYLESFAADKTLVRGTCSEQGFTVADSRHTLPVPFLGEALTATSWKKSAWDASALKGFLTAPLMFIGRPFVDAFSPLQRPGVKAAAPKPEASSGFLSRGANSKLQMQSGNAGFGRRDVFGLGVASAAAAALGKPLPASAAGVPSKEELNKLTLGYGRMQLLLTDWTKITSGSCDGATLSDEKKQVVPVNGGDLCGTSPLVVQQYIGYRSINDPLYQSEKLMLRAAPLIKDPNRSDEYLEAVNQWGQQIQMSSLNAYTSAWGEANPNGSKAQQAAYLQEAKLDVEESAELLKRILQMLDLPLKAA